MGQIDCYDLACRRGDFSLSVERLSLRHGEKIALLGENGCGKTTLLQILAGLLPAGGRIIYRECAGKPLLAGSNPSEVEQTGVLEGEDKAQPLGVGNAEEIVTGPGQARLITSDKAGASGHAGEAVNSRTAPAALKHQDSPAGLPLKADACPYPEVRWDRLGARSRSEYMAYLPQEVSVLFNLTVGELIGLSLAEQTTAPVPQSESSAQFASVTQSAHSMPTPPPLPLLLTGVARRLVLEATEMEDFLHRPYHSLSGGERRRAMLARVLCRGRAFVFLDEPTAPLDMRHSAQFMRHAAASPPAVLAAMHDLNLAVRHFDRFLLMKNGRILFDRSKHELQAHELEEIYGIRLQNCGGHFIPEL